MTLPNFDYDVTMEQGAANTIQILYKMRRLELARKGHETRFWDKNRHNEQSLTKESRESVRFLKRFLEHPLLTSSNYPGGPLLVYDHTLLREHEKVMIANGVFDI